MTITATGQDAMDASALPTCLEFILDETQSMDWNGRRQGLINGYNEFIADQRSQAGICRATMTKFSTSRVRTPYVDLDVAMVPRLTRTTFTPDGGTNLRDVIIDRIEALRDRLAGLEIQPNVVMIVMTDGEDNRSSRSEAAVRSLIREQIEKGWTFVYLGADQRANAIGDSLGFPEGNIKSFASAEMEQTLRQTANATTAYRSARASGTIAAHTATMNYFSEPSSC